MYRCGYNSAGRGAGPEARAQAQARAWARAQARARARGAGAGVGARRRRGRGRRRGFRRGREARGARRGYVHTGTGARRKLRFKRTFGMQHRFGHGQIMGADVRLRHTSKARADYKWHNADVRTRAKHAHVQSAGAPDNARAQIRRRTSGAWSSRRIVPASAV